MRTWLGVVVAIAACKGKAAEQKAVGSAAPVVATAGSAVGSAAAAAPAKKQLSNAQLADYKKHMKAGWALQKQEKWADAVPEFEAALKAVDVDPRALTELGWSAMNAGDYKKARRADDQAVRLAIDPKVKAAALYNLGTVEQMTGDVDDARAAFTQSLALRPNKTVEQALAKLGAKPEQAAPLCKPGEEVCACLKAQIDPDPEADIKCAASSEPLIAIPSWKVFQLENMPWTYRYLLDEHGEVVAQIGQTLDRMKVTEDRHLDKAELKTIAGHRVLRLEIVDSAQQTEGGMDDAYNEIVTDSSREVTICVVGDDKTPTRCPVSGVPIEVTHDEDYIGEGNVPPGKSKTAKLAIDIADSGVATVTVPKGASSEGLDGYVGPTKLW